MPRMADVAIRRLSFSYVVRAAQQICYLDSFLLYLKYALYSDYKRFCVTNF